MHMVVEPSLLYFGTPVVLISTLNQDRSVNVAPMSSAWWLGWNCMLGLGHDAQTTRNLLREKECVLNLAGTANVDAVDRLARLTGASPLTPWKEAAGYRHEPDKLGVTGLSVTSSEVISTPRINECPIQLEAVLETTRPFGHGPSCNADAYAFEARVVRAHIEASLLIPGRKNHFDPDKWKPLIMSFCQFYGLGERIRPSTLASILEEAYRPAKHMAL
jgi:flavin reductase (DIM6/NTAB) family NADH-FMN oxidoreductase RutF